MINALRKFTKFGFAMMVLGVIPHNSPFAKDQSAQIFADQSQMTDAEYAQWMQLYFGPPSPPTFNVPFLALYNPQMTPAEYAYWMTLYFGQPTVPPTSP